MIKAMHLCVFFVMLILLEGCSVFYVMKQGMFQLELLSDAEPIEMALRKTSLPENQRKKLELIVDVRAFAAENLKLNVHKNYKDVNLSWNKSIHTITASAPLSFTPYLWWFPIAGSVPYKGFFSEQDADHEQAQLVAKGYETQKREIHGYSTLGYFSDPVWPAMLLMSDLSLIELIIHELTHATVYIPNQTSFNETFANFVGKKGAEAYVRHRFGDSGVMRQKLNDYELSSKRYHDFFQALYSRLNELYSKPISDEEKMRMKQEILDEARIEYGTLVANNLLPDIDFSRVNNAFLLSFKSYNDDSEVFEQMFSLVGNDFGAFIDDVNFYARTGKPFVSLRERVQHLVEKL